METLFSSHGTRCSHDWTLMLTANTWRGSLLSGFFLWEAVLISCWANWKEVTMNISPFLGCISCSSTSQRESPYILVLEFFWMGDSSKRTYSQQWLAHWPVNQIFIFNSVDQLKEPESLRAIVESRITIETVMMNLEKHKKVWWLGVGGVSRKKTRGMW